MLSFKERLKRNIEEAEKEIEELKQPLYKITSIDQLFDQAKEELMEKIKNSILEFSEGGVKIIELKVEKLNTSFPPIRLSIINLSEQQNLLLLLSTGNRRGIRSNILDFIPIPDIMKTYVDFNPISEFSIREKLVDTIAENLKEEGLSIIANTELKSIKICLE